MWCIQNAVQMCLVLGTPVICFVQLVINLHSYRAVKTSFRIAKSQPVCITHMLRDHWALLILDAWSADFLHSRRHTKLKSTWDTHSWGRRDKTTPSLASQLAWLLPWASVHCSFVHSSHIPCEEDFSDLSSASERVFWGDVLSSWLYLPCSCSYCEHPLKCTPFFTRAHDGFYAALDVVSLFTALPVSLEQSGTWGCSVHH